MEDNCQGEPHSLPIRMPKKGKNELVFKLEISPRYKNLSLCVKNIFGLFSNERQKGGQKFLCLECDHYLDRDMNEKGRTTHINEPSHLFKSLPD